MGDEVFGAGKNIKCFDKIKIQNLKLKARLHCESKYYREGSLNEIVSCHRGRNDSDWFVVRNAKKSDLSPNYIFKGGDILVLTHMVSNKNIHASGEYDSPISVQCEVSACMNSDPGNCCPEDEWRVDLVEAADDYWRVGSTFKLTNLSANNLLSSHKKELQENHEFEVYVPRPKSEDNPDPEAKNSEWVICEHQPFIYTAPVVIETNKAKKTEDTDQLDLLRDKKRDYSQSKTSMLEKDRDPQLYQKDMMRQFNNSLTREVETKKLMFRERPWWKKYLCCCFYPQPVSEEGYIQLS